MPTGTSESTDTNNYGGPNTGVNTGEQDGGFGGGDFSAPVVVKPEIVSTLPAPENLDTNVVFDTVIASWDAVADPTQTVVKYNIECRTYFKEGSGFENASIFRWLQTSDEVEISFSMPIGRYQLRVTAIDKQGNGYTQTAGVVGLDDIDTAHIAGVDFEILDIGPDGADNYYSQLVLKEDPDYYYKLNEPTNSATVKNSGTAGNDLIVLSNTNNGTFFKSAPALFGSEDNTSSQYLEIPYQETIGSTTGPSLFTPSGLGHTIEFVCKGASSNLYPISIYGGSGGYFAGNTSNGQYRWYTDNGSFYLGGTLLAFQGTLYMVGVGKFVSGSSTEDTIPLLPVGTLTPGQIFHVAVRVTPSDISIFLDGTKLITYENAGNVSGSALPAGKINNSHIAQARTAQKLLRIGFVPRVGSDFTGGDFLLGHVAYYNEPLKDLTVKLHYDAMLNGKPKDPTPKGDPDSPTGTDDGTGTDIDDDDEPGGTDVTGDPHLYWSVTDLPDGVKGKAYDDGFGILASGASGIKYSAKNLPAGLNMAYASGKVSGTPTKTGRYNVRLSAASGSRRIYKNEYITITAAPGSPGAPGSDKECNQTALIGLQADVLQAKLHPGGHEYSDIADDKSLTTDQKLIKIKSLIATNNLTVTLDDLKNDPALQKKIVAINKDCDTGVLSIFIGGTTIVLPPYKGPGQGSISFRIEDGILYLLHDGKVYYAIQLPSSVLINLSGGNGLTWWFDSTGNLNTTPEDIPFDYIVPGGTWFVNANYRTIAGLKSPFKYSYSPVKQGRSVLINPDGTATVGSELPYEMVQRALEVYYGGRTPGSYYKLSERAKYAIVRSGYMTLLQTFHSDTE